MTGRISPLQSSFLILVHAHAGRNQTGTWKQSVGDAGPIIRLLGVCSSHTRSVRLLFRGESMGSFMLRIVTIVGQNWILLWPWLCKHEIFLTENGV